jgi:DNA polymerase V
MTVFALVDCNNFYCSCERVFRPDLEGRAMVVLSNNDGCAVARSNESKALGIPMAEPAFKFRKLVESGQVVALSSNYTLYGDMSSRVMSVLGDHTPGIEVYSIDEAFLDLTGLPGEDLTQWCLDMRARVKQWTGIPVSIGVARTKTLAKLANRLAKKSTKTQGALDLANHSEWLERALKKTDVGDVWGIGKQWATACHGHGVHSAWDLTQASDGWIKKTMGAPGLRTAMELRGHAVHTLETQPEDRQSCCCSRSFGDCITSFNEVRDAVVTFATRASEKIRHDGLVTGIVQTFLMTDRFRHDDPQRSATISVDIRPTASTPEIITAATHGLTAAWADGFRYKKAGVILLELVRPEDISRDLFAPKVPPQDTKLMQALDATNKRFGRDTIRFGQVERKAPWHMLSENKTPSYTTQWSDIPVVKAG